MTKTVQKQITKHTHTRTHTHTHTRQQQQTKICRSYPALSPGEASDAKTVGSYHGGKGFKKNIGKHSKS